jgi:hypothetical protein
MLQMIACVGTVAVRPTLPRLAVMLDAVRERLAEIARGKL